MGQYYRAVNLDKREKLIPYDYNNGSKLMEHSYVQNAFLNAAEYLLSEGQPWHKTRLVWAGDYMDPGIFITPIGVKGDVRSFFPDAEMNLYEYADDAFESVRTKSTSNDDLRYIVNHTQKQYCDKFDGENKDDWIIHPLSLLTSSGNGRGSGDFHTEDERFVGSWAGDVISMEIVIPNSFKKISPNFKE